MRQHVNPLSRNFDEIESIPSFSEMFDDSKLNLHLDIASAAGLVSSFLTSAFGASASFFLSFLGIALLGLFPASGIGIKLFSPKILATLDVGCAPWLSQYFILSFCRPILSFFSFGNKGLKKPNFSINLPSLANLLSATTILYTGLFFCSPS